MSTAWRIVIGCAAVGFILPLAMLAYYSFSNTGAGSLYVALCPVCIASLALDHASRSIALVAWILFCIINAVLYAIPGLLVVLIRSFRTRS
jgi:hypothetical protein